MIRVQTAPFDPHAEAAAFAKGRGEAGALATFVGSVRASAHGGMVYSLELETYPGFTEKQIAQIEADARARFDVIDTFVIHRYGQMKVGEAIVFVAALSKHRREALQAVDYLMDRLKTEAPFWKKELRPEGEEWIEPRADDREARAKWDGGPGKDHPVRVRWTDPQRPFSSGQYSTVARFDEDRADWPKTAWSVTLNLREALAAGDCLADARFLGPDAPQERLRSGVRFEMLEGNRVTAIVEVL
jgi:molybdopterin synthase catalytic subunit